MWAGIDWEFGINVYTLLDLKWIKKNYLKRYMTVNSFLIDTYILYDIYYIFVFVSYYEKYKLQGWRPDLCSPGDGCEKKGCL